MILSCIHLYEYLHSNKESKLVFEKIMKYMLLLFRKDHLTDIIPENPTCKDCINNKIINLHICVNCCYIGCFKNHIKEHFLKEQHILALNLHYGIIFCFECNDYKYNLKTEELFNIFFQKNKIFRFGAFTDWESSNFNIKIINKNMNKKFKIIQTNDDLKITTLRGFLNLGNTCFMNCILQTLIHTPMLRDYFLSDKHYCTNFNTRTNKDMKNNKDIYNIYSKSNCLVCELSIVFQEFYSDKFVPYIPYELLHLIWTQVKHLAGYEQQDAHEFFIATLNAVHRHSIESSSLFNGIEKLHNIQCVCIIDKIFTGCLQSVLTCSNCKNISSKEEPFWDISLDLGRNNYNELNNDKWNLKPTKTNHNIILLNSLEDCLKRFTQPEIVTNLKCSFCYNFHDASKQLTFQKIPIVACFHLKRFEQTTKLHKKISLHIPFPELLDMTPFLSNKSLPKLNKQQQNSYKKNLYILFAVVNHHGSIESGHYTCFIRLSKNKWFRCNDHIINEVSINDVLNSEGYLLFYHKIWVDYIE